MEGFSFEINEEVVEKEIIEEDIFIEPSLEDAVFTPIKVFKVSDYVPMGEAGDKKYIELNSTWKIMVGFTFQIQ